MAAFVRQMFCIFRVCSYHICQQGEPTMLTIHTMTAWCFHVFHHLVISVVSAQQNAVTYYCMLCYVLGSLYGSMELKSCSCHFWSFRSKQCLFFSSLSCLWVRQCGIRPFFFSLIESVYFRSAEIIFIMFTRLWEAAEKMIKLNDQYLLDFNLPQNGCIVVLLQNKHINHMLHDALSSKIPHLGNLLLNWRN